MNIQELLSGSTQTTQSTRGKGQEELGQGDFLKLLVAQMQHQDPSNPAESGEFLTQIAQFSMVDGIDNLNKSFDGMASDVFTNQAMYASQLVGREVLSETDLGYIAEGDTLDGVVAVPEAAQGLNVQVRDVDGKLVKTIDTTDFTSGGPWSFNWDGTNEHGEAMAPGAYVVSATALVDGEKQPLPVGLYNTVDSITLNREGNRVEVQLLSSERVGLNAVVQYR